MTSLRARLGRLGLVVLHCENAGGDDRTLCGDSLDIGDTENDPEIKNPIIAKQNEPITCEECLRIIRKCRSITPWRVGAA